MHVKGVQWAGIGYTKGAALGRRWSVTFPVKERYGGTGNSMSHFSPHLLKRNGLRPTLTKNWTSTRALLKTQHQKKSKGVCFILSKKPPKQETIFSCFLLLPITPQDYGSYYASLYSTYIFLSTPKEKFCLLPLTDSYFDSSFLRVHPHLLP